MLNHIMVDFRIAGALINLFYSQRVADKSDSIEIARLMKQKLNSKNNLEKYLNIHHSQSQKIFKDIDEVININFPQLEIDIIRKYVTLGSYQLKQSYGYLAEHLKKNGRYKFKIAEQVVTENNYKITFSEIHSRHSDSIKYKVFVKFLPDSNDHNSLEWICSCKSGKRTVGCCTHVASVIYYLACGHRCEKIPTPGLRLNSILIPVCLNTEDYDQGEELENSENSDDDNENIEKSEMIYESDENEEVQLNSLVKRSLSFYSENQSKRQFRSNK